MQRSLDEEAQTFRAVRNPRLRKSRRQSSTSWHQDRIDEKDADRAPKYGDTSAAYWKLYKSEAEANDNVLVESLKGNTESMGFLCTLFSSIVASFIIEIYKTLQTAGGPSNIAVRINIVLFFSFGLSITSAVSCTLIQQWCSEYLTFAYPRAAPHDSGRVRTYLFQGLRQFQMRRFMYGTYVLLHLSVFLFFWALSDFFYSVYHPFGIVARYSLVASAIVYILLSILPLIFSNSPYNTPMTPPLRAGIIILRIIIRFPKWFPKWYRSKPFDLTGLQYYDGLHFDKAHLYSMEAGKRAEKLEPYAIKWLFTEDDFSDEDMDKFLKGLPGYISSGHTKKGQLDQYLTADFILNRIKEHFITCATSVEISNETSIARVSSSVKALLGIFQYSRIRKEGFSMPDNLKLEILKEDSQLQRTYIQMLIDDFQKFCDMDDQMIALRASCIRALAIQGLLSHLVPQDNRTTDMSRFPAPLIPIYKFFFPNDHMDTISQLDRGDIPSPLEIKKMWKSLLHDGPLANLTTLAQAVLKRDRAPTSGLSFCWKTLDILLKQFGTFHSNEPTRAQSEFDNLHKHIRTYVRDDERGFRVTPLLDILDIVARGRRLLMVFSGHPKYHNRTDVVFGREYLRNGDPLEAFAHCLPAFISDNSESPEVCRDFMEKVVRDDGLWTSLQVNLWNAQRLEGPTPDKLRIFEDCCTVIDLAFSVLEDSQKVDWRAPEFGSLAQHFESFITDYFQDAFMGRSTSFRIGIIKARFCKALLAQFWNDIDREGTVSFRSQWDVASLARLIYTLGLRDKDDAEFWDSYVNGGHIGVELTAKAFEMVKITERDGPLLIFCQLGHLVATAVPLNHSGLDPEDIKEVWKTQKKVIKNTRLPLNRASHSVWEEVGQLRKQAIDLCGKNTGRDRKILRRLLRMIDNVCSHRSSGSEGSSKGEPAEERDPKTSVALDSMSSSGDLRGFSNRFSSVSESTAVMRGLSSGTQTSESEDSFEESSAEKNLDHERKTYYVRSESPQSSEPGSHSLPPRRPTLQGIASMGILDRPDTSPLFPISPVVPIPYMGDARQRRTYSSPRRTGSGFSAIRPSLVTRGGTGMLFTSRRDTPAAPPVPEPVISSSYGFSDLSDEGQSGAESSSPPGRP